MRIVRGLGGTGRIYSDPRHSSLRMGQSVCVWGGGGGDSKTSLGWGRWCYVEERSARQHTEVFINCQIHLKYLPYYTFPCEYHTDNI